MRGHSLDAGRLAHATGLDEQSIDAWLRGDSVADLLQARELARILHLDGGNLAAGAAKTWYPLAPDAPQVRTHSQAPHPSNGYVFSLDAGKRAALVDPAGIPEHLLRILREGAYHLQYILVTHKHADHCDAVADVAAAFPEARITMHALDAPALGSLRSRALLVRDGEELPFGNDVRIRALHTPGHTDGSVSYLMQSTLFTGDMLFAGSVGGAFGDVTGYADILNSIRSKIFTLPDETVVMPGHGPPTTLAQERAHNPFFPTKHEHDDRLA